MAPLIRGLRGSLRTCAESLGLAQSDANALWVLAAAGPLATKDLAQHLDMDPADASTMLARLGQRGLVEREPSEEDRRKRVASLTGAGRETRRALASCVG